MPKLHSDDLFSVIMNPHQPIATRLWSPFPPSRTVYTEQISGQRATRSPKPFRSVLRHPWHVARVATLSKRCRWCRMRATFCRRSAPGRPRGGRRSRCPAHMVTHRRAAAVGVAEHVQAALHPQLLPPGPYRTVRDNGGAQDAQSAE